MNPLITCSLCGQSFDPSQHVACKSCPLQKGCALVCCPNCGYEMIDVNQSMLARLAGRWFLPKSGHLFKDQSQESSSHISQIGDRKIGP